MKTASLYVLGCVIGACLTVGAYHAYQNYSHYKEACLECAARCEGYALEVSTFRTPEGVRDCYCDTSKPGPDRLRKDQAQEAIDRITTQPPDDFRI